MNGQFKQTLIDYILSGHAYLHAHTPEKTRFISELKEIAAGLPEQGRPVFVWSPATGCRGEGCGRVPGNRVRCLLESSHAPRFSSLLPVQPRSGSPHA
jgi:hypothetical protein